MTAITKENVMSLVKSDVEFPVNFDDAWQWLEYSKKGHAKESLLKCGFIEKVDYIVFPVERENSVGRPSETISLTTDCFKQWSMMSGTPKGKEVRLYFIECEKELKALKSKPVSSLAVLAEVVAMLQKQEQEMLALQAATQKVEQQVHELDIKLESATNYYSVLAYAKMHDIKLGRSDANSIGRKASSLSKQMNLCVSRVPDERYGKVNAYYEDVLKPAFAAYGYIV